MKEANLSISGMSCSTCANAIESKLRQIIGVNNATVHLMTECAVVCYQPKVTSELQLIAAINSLGFKAHVTGEKCSKPNNSCVWLCLALAIPEFIICMLLPYWPAANNLLSRHIIGQLRITDLIEFLLTTPIQYVIGKRLFIKSKAMLTENVFTMDLLILVATSVAYVYSVCMIMLAIFNVSPAMTFFEASATLLTFLTCSKGIEQRTKLQTNKTLQKLTKSRPTRARLLKDASGKIETLVDIEVIQVNDLVRIMPGESVPVDGVVTSGQSKLNESLINGESKPMTKKIGDNVYAGALNLNSPFILKSTAKASDSFISKILATIQKSQSFKTVTQMQADFIAKFFIPGILSLSLLTLVAWIVVFSFYNPQELGFSSGIPPFFIALKFSIAVLAVACPCSLTLAVPTANAVGIGIAAEKGILIKGGQIFENASRLEYVVFDKTGTLTKGETNLVQFQLVPEISNSILVALLYAIEKESEHYCSTIICNYLQKVYPNALESMLPLIHLKKYHKEPGCGISGIFTVYQEEYVFYAGRISWILENSNDNQYFREHYLEIEGMLCSGNTIVGLAFNKVFCGFIALNDQLKRDAEHCIDQLKQMHLKSVILSGDSLKTVRFVANQLGISTYFSEVTPIGKASIIRSLQSQSAIAMVGDGINDSAALTQAEIGIVVCNGTDLAFECADVVLVKTGLWRIPFLFVLAKVVKRTIFFNFLISFCYNLIMLPLASGLFYTTTGITLHPWICALTMTLSSMTVVCSSLAIRINPTIKKYFACD